MAAVFAVAIQPWIHRASHPIMRNLRSPSQLGPSIGWSFIVLVGWVLLTFCAPLAGAGSMPGDWYQSLRKPEWNPPSWVFGPVWTLLYLMMAVAAWLVWRKGGWQCRSRELGAYLMQLALNAAWTPLFFGLRRPGLALVEIVCLLVAVIWTACLFRRVSAAAGALMVPYGLWVSFATVLNATLWWMNRG